MARGVFLYESVGRPALPEPLPALRQTRPGEPIVFKFMLKLERPTDALPVLHVYQRHPDVSSATLAQSAEHPDLYDVEVKCHSTVRWVREDLLSAHLNFLGTLVRPTAWERIIADDE